MASVKFRLRSSINKKVSIYIYISLGRGEMYQSKTGFTILPKDWSKSTAKPKQNSEENRFIFSQLSKLESYIHDEINKANAKGKQINLQWLQLKIGECFNRQEKKDIGLVVNHVEYIIENSSTRKIKGSNKIGLSERRVAGYKSFKNIFEAFQLECNLKINFNDLDKALIEKFTNWLIKKRNYSINHAGKQIDNLKTVCRDAEKLGIKVHPYTKHIEGFKEQNDDRYIVTLSFEELDQIRFSELKEEALINARKWLLIGCEIGQRAGDLLKLTKDDIRYEKGNYYMDIEQQKTGKFTTVGLIAPHIIDIITNEFPYSISLQKLNKHIKKVCEKSGINEMIKGKKYDSVSKRKKLDYYPKFELITSHSFRRSFATNYYKKIPTPVLINITGHSKESLFLDYINKREDKDENANLFMKFYNEIHKSKEPKLKLVKSNI